MIILSHTIDFTYKLLIWYMIIRIFHRVTCYVSPRKDPFMVSQKWWCKVDERSPSIAEEENFGQLRHHCVPVFVEFLYSVRLDNSRKPIRLHNIDVAQLIPSPYARLISLCWERKSCPGEKGNSDEGGYIFRIEFRSKFNLALVSFDKKY